MKVLLAKEAHFGLKCLHFVTNPATLSACKKNITLQGDNAMKNEKALNPKVSNILIVDDMGANLKLLDDILLPEGYQTRLVPGGEMALQAAKIDKPDLILLDIMMPGMDGFEVCRRLKEIPGLADIPVIFISALGDTDDIVKALAIGGVDYINKPFQAEEVKARINTHLKLHRHSEELLELNEVLQHQSMALQQQGKELQDLNATKDKFFSIIAHDLRSPFNGFLGLTQLMAEELENLTSEEIKDFTLSMRNSAADMFRLLENLLEWARMQQGLITFNREIAQLAPIVDESIAIILEPAKIKGIEINLDIPDDITVFADRNILQTVIRNIVSNAVKFTPKGGIIRVSAKVTDYNNVEISIKDTGIGMSNKIIDDLFRLDVQTNRKGTEGEPSSGLGLLLCKDFIEKHSGKIWVESEEGKGSVFFFTIPGKNPLS